MSSPFALKFLGKKPFTSKTVNPEAGGKDYEAMGDAARKREQKLSAETGDTDYEAKLKVQKEMSPLNGAYASGAGGTQYVSTAGAFQRLQDQISKSVEASLDRQRDFDAGSAKMEDWDTIGEPGARFSTQEEFFDFFGRKDKKK